MSQSSESRYVPALGVHWLTPTYDVVVRLTTREKIFKTALLEQANIEPGQEVLDLACGTGTLAILAKKSHPQTNVTAIDGDLNILTIADRKAKQANVAIHFDHGLSFSLPYSNERFDLRFIEPVFSSSILVR